LLLVFAWWAVQNAQDSAGVTRTPKAPANSDRLLASLVKHDLDLAISETPAQRVAVLAELADDLRGESAMLIQGPPAKDLLADLARLYRQVVTNGLVPNARELAAGQRQPLLDIARQLAERSREAEQLAQAAPADSADSLRAIAATARDGDQQLRALIGGPTP
jgi:hypothetical protein